MDTSQLHLLEPTEPGLNQSSEDADKTWRKDLEMTNTKPKVVTCINGFGMIEA